MTNDSVTSARPPASCPPSHVPAVLVSNLHVKLTHRVMMMDSSIVDMLQSTTMHVSVTNIYSVVALLTIIKLHLLKVCICG